MPQQSARAAVGDQSGGGAVLTPIRRLTLAGFGVIAGAIVVVVGSQLTWVKATFGGTSVPRPGLPPITLGGGEVRLAAGDIGAGYLFGLALLLALVPLGWIAVGPRGRIALGAIGLAIAIGIGVGIADARKGMTAEAGRQGRILVGGDRDASYRVSSGIGSGVTAAGAALGGLSALAGASAGARVPKLRMPEKPPDGGPA